MGAECRKVLRNLNLTEEDSKDPDKILQALDDQFLKQNNILFERYKFYNAVQQQNESIEQYVDRLRYLVRTCKLEAVEDDMIRDRLVLGAKDSAARARIFRQKEIASLKDSIAVLKISESTKQQIQSMSVEDQSAVNYVKHKNKHNPKKFTYQKGTSSKPVIKNCQACGNTHERRKCKAYGTKCTKCGKMNHFPSVCRNTKQATHSKQRRTPRTHQVEEDEDSSSESNFHLESVEAVNNIGDKKLMLMLQVETLSGTSANIECEIDTGASCCIMSQDDLDKIEMNMKLMHSSTKLKMYNDQKVKVHGEVELKCLYKGNEYKLPFKIMHTTQAPLLSRAKALEMGLITVAEDIHQTTVQDSIKSILDTYSDVFEGLGCLPGEYEITIDESIQPVKNQPRRVAVAIKDELKCKLLDLEQRGIIEKVTEPTDLLSSMVVVKKPGKLRICLDPKPLNTAIKRANYMMPTVEDILPKLAKARIFSVLDDKDGFWQVKLTKKSSFLTTFGTPFGRYRYHRMPFGISTAPEEFQRRQHEISEDLHGVAVIADDYLVYGCGETDQEAKDDHNANLRAFLKKARQVNLKLNRKKARMGFDQIQRK
ncbi:uncharacterized protein K02A2.6-like [Anneissia japonica]|uniref:uncharacterized protein K02A2.6-like n=1 Tax=Anneissia japonica TaxID=1529436 RepID=UPI0014256273|nr:uncharacterized protein K02A2.6-like [Anneissia japonica]